MAGSASSCSAKGIQRSTRQANTRAITCRSVSDARGIHVAAVASSTRALGSVCTKMLSTLAPTDLLRSPRSFSRAYRELVEVLHDQRRIFPQDHPRRVRESAKYRPVELQTKTSQSSSSL